MTDRTNETNRTNGTDRASQRILVLGVGNPLMGDEGIGPRIVEHLLSNYRFPESLQVVDAGTMGFSILNLFREADAVLVVDAVRGSGEEPGTVLSLAPEAMAANQIMHSLHDTRLVDVLDAARLMGLDPHVDCIGVEIAEIVHWQVELSPVVEAAVPFAAQAVVDRLAEWGILAEQAACAAQGASTSPEPAGDSSCGPPETSAVIKAMRTKDDVGS